MKYPGDLKFRPIISCRTCPTKRLCELLDKIIRPFLVKVKFRLQDTWQFLRECPKQLEPGSYIVTADITSLYTNITTDSGISAISYYYDLCSKDPTINIPARMTKEFVIALYTFLQNNLYFTFRGIVYKQCSGTGMGKDYAPGIADMKVGFDEVKLESFVRRTFDGSTADLFIKWYWRYLDDVFIVWQQDKQNELEEIKAFMNSIDQKIQYTFESSLEDINNGAAYLDVWVTVQTDGLVQTDMYAKPTDTFNYLPFGSCHPRHVVRNIPFVLARRIRGIVSDEKALEGRFSEMTTRLKAKKYPKQLIKGAIARAMSLDRMDIITTNKKVNEPSTAITTPTQKEIHYVTTYNGLTDNATNNARVGIDTLNSLLPAAKHMRLVSSMRRSPNLGDLLVAQKE